MGRRNFILKSYKVISDLHHDPENQDNFVGKDLADK